LQGITVLDLILGSIFLYFFIRGFKKGFIKQTSTILGIIIALIGAIRYYDQFRIFLADFIDASLPLLQFISFAVIFIILNLVIHILGLIIKNIVDIIFLEPVDRILGGLLGVVKGGLICYLFVLILDQIPYTQVVDIVDSSYLAANLLKLTPIIQENIQSIFDHNV